MAKHATPSKVEQVSDNAFSILLIVLFVGSIFSFFYFTFFQDLGTNSLLSVSGTAGSAVLYMKWNVIRRTRINNASPSEIADLLNSSSEKS